MDQEVTSGEFDSMIIKLTLDAFTAEKLAVKKPRSLPLATYCALLIEEALDRCDTLAERPEGSEASNSSSTSIKELNLKQDNNVVKSRKSRSIPQYSSEFIDFWDTYQKSPSKVLGQSKIKAFEQWKEVIKLESPERLVEAARRVVDLIERGDT